MTIMLTFTNLILFVMLAPFFDGVIRKVTARVQSRSGPPLLQSYYDILKLLGKENIDSAGTWPFHVAPIVALSSILAVVAILPLAGTGTALTPYADTISVVYLLTLGGVAVLFGALASRSTYALMGASREMITMIMVEPILALSLMAGVLSQKSLGITAALYGTSGALFSWSTIIMLVVYLLALQAFVARQPFDIPEAEIELLGGPFIEYSGPNLGFFKFYIMIKQMLYAYLMVAVFIPLLGSGFYILDLAVQLLATFLVFLLIGLLASTNPRFRIDQAVRYYAVLIFASFGALGLSLYGY